MKPLLVVDLWRREIMFKFLLKMLYTVEGNLRKI